MISWLLTQVIHHCPKLLDFGIELEEKALQVLEGEDQGKLFDQAFLEKAYQVALVGVSHAKEDTTEHPIALDCEEQVFWLLRDVLIIM